MARGAGELSARQKATVSLGWFAMVVGTLLGVGTYSHRGGLGLVKVLPNPQQPRTRYLVPDDRDFFAVYKRLVGPITVPFK